VSVLNAELLDPFNGLDVCLLTNHREVKLYVLRLWGSSFFDRDVMFLLMMSSDKWFLMSIRVVVVTRAELRFKFSQTP
jgi:hypothetical protein